MKGKGLTRKPFKRPARGSKRPQVKRKPTKRIKPRALKKKLEALQKQLTIKYHGDSCFTCPQKNLKKSNAQLGHVPWPRSVLSTECKFDTRFTRIQCFLCNIHRGGMGAVALERMKREGINTIALWEFNEQTKGLTYPLKWFELRIKAYEEQLKEYDEKNR